MSIPKAPQRVKLFFSVFASTGDYLEKAFKELSKIFGEVDFETDVFAFEITRYYEEEFGANLKRKLFSIKDLIMPNDIIDIKLLAYKLEDSFSTDGKRNVNIDPGYVALSRVVLSTGKDYTHRIYLDKGVYGDLTLIYKKKRGFMPLPWTYPDYRSNDFLNFFSHVRDILKMQLKG